MPEFRGPIRRVDTPKGHHYRDADDRRVPGVTTIKGGGLPENRGLKHWRGTVTAGWAVDHWDELSRMAISERIERIGKAQYKVRDRAGNRGREVHELAELLVRGEQVDVPEAIEDHVESYVHFLDEWEPEVLYTELSVYSVEHGYAGTLDGIFFIPSLAQTLLIDIKTSNSGIFGDVAVQLAPYRFAECYLDEENESHPMIPVDGCAGIHVRADGYDLIPVRAEREQFEVFLRAAQMKRFAEHAHELAGEPLLPPTARNRRQLVGVHPKEIAS